MLLDVSEQNSAYTCT